LISASFSFYWSVLGIGVILGQLGEESKEYVIAYASKATTKLRAITLHTKGSVLLLYGPSSILRPYFYGTKFTLYIDHQLIKWLMTNDKLTNKLIRWVFIFQEYEFKVIHRHGITH
jgi:hypothetical protein